MGSRVLKRRILKSLRLLATMVNYFLAGNYLWFCERYKYEGENPSSYVKAMTVL